MYKKIILNALLSLALLFLLLSGCSGAGNNSIETSQSKQQSKDDSEAKIGDGKKIYRPDEGSFSHDAKYSDIKIETEEEALAKGKTILTLADGIGSGGEVAKIIRAFNKDNDYYHVELKEWEQISREEEQTRIKIDLARGQGPDLMTLSAVPDAARIMSTGCFADLSDFLRELNISDENYFPSVRAFTIGDEVYGICPSTGCMTYCIKSDLCVNGQVPSFEEFIDNLLWYPENAILMDDINPATGILGGLLIHSQSLRGTVDWDKRKCDFSGELFSKILDVSKRYGDAIGKGYEPITQRYLLSIGTYPGEEALLNRGWVKTDYWFDDGNYPLYSTGVDIMINAATENLDGAKAFLSYALSAYGQMHCGDPVNREVYKDSMRDMLSMVEAGRANMPEKLTQSIVDEMTSNINRGRYAPQDTREIIDIIMEESGAYFSGEKSKEEVIKIIQSRVQLMLSE